MGRSQETFSKKEKVKTKDKKRKDKEKRKEDRKANASKGQQLDTMLAYVDENGNLTSTPPDPLKRTVIEMDNIVIQVSRQENGPTQANQEGIVSSYTESKGYGFIKEVQFQQTLFFHKSGLIDRVHLTDKVSFQIEKTPKGLNAIEIRKRI